MSSTVFCAEIRIDPRLRAIVFGSGAIFGLVGVAAIFQMPLPLAVRLSAMGAWVALSAYQLEVLRRAYRRARCYRVFADGSIDVSGLPGGRLTAVYAAGSVILPRAAWLRVRDVQGRSWGELIVGNTREDKEWRRFQVICRHVAAC